MATVEATTQKVQRILAEEYNDVRLRKNGGWVCALHTESIKGDPWGRDRVPAAT